MTKAMIVYNPDSGERRGQQLANVLDESIRHQYDTITLKRTSNEKDIADFSQESAVMHYDALFILGGDGTVNLAVNGLLKEDYSPNIGIIPAGTINNFARMLNIPIIPHQAIEQLSNAQIKMVDIGKFKDTYFVSTVASGPIPEIGRKISSEDKKRLGPIAYIKEGLVAVNNDETHLIELTLDDEEIVSEEFSLIMATTGNSIFGWHNFFPQASLYDGKINVMGLRKSTPNQKLSLIPEILSDNDNYSELLFSGKYDNVSIKTKYNKELKTTVDGNEGPNLPGDISIGARLPFFVVS